MSPICAYNDDLPGRTSRPRFIGVDPKMKVIDGIDRIHPWLRFNCTRSIFAKAENFKTKIGDRVVTEA